MAEAPVTGQRRPMFYGTKGSSLTGSLAGERPALAGDGPVPAVSPGYRPAVGLGIGGYYLYRFAEDTEKGKAAGIETRGISDHHFIDSIYFRDPNGYVVELTAKRPGHDEEMQHSVVARARIDIGDA